MKRTYNISFFKDCRKLTHTCIGIHTYVHAHSVRLRNDLIVCIAFALHLIDTADILIFFNLDFLFILRKQFL